MAQDIYPAISGNLINNGGITIQCESRKFSYLNTGPSNENLPNMATISGRWLDRFDDTNYYGVS